MPNQTPKARYVQSEDDLQKMLDTTAHAFCEEFLRIRRDFASHQQRPHHRPELSRILEVDGRIVSSVLVVDRHFRIGASTLRLAGIGDVATHPDERKHGYCATLFQDVLRFMEEDGFHISLLFGIPNFYHRFGYAVALCSPSVAIPTGHLAELNAAMPARPMRDDDLPALSALLEADTLSRGCGLVRDDAYWRYYEDLRNRVTVLDDDGRPAAYFAARDEKTELVLDEAVVDGSEQACRSLLAYAGKRAKNAGKERVTLWAITPDHPIGRLAAMCGAEFTARYPRRSDAMMRIVRLHDTVARLRPELERRLSTSPMANQSARFGVETDIGSFGLAIEEGSVQILPAAQPCAQMPQWALLQMAVGFASPADQVLAENASIPTEVMPWLSAMFPRRWPTVQPVDGF